MFDKNVALEYGPVEFGLVQSKTCPWLASSIDGFTILKVDGLLKEVVIEIKTMSATSTNSKVTKNVN